MIDAVIFDMDGLLIDSEPLWKKAEQRAFSQTGLTLTEEMCAETTGYDSWDVIRHWYKYKSWDKEKIAFDKVKEDIDTEFLSLLSQEGETKPGVDYIINFFKSKKIRMALASSSPQVIIDAILKKMGLRNMFEVVLSSETVDYGKPHPAVYIEATKKLNVNPLHTLAFEDSFYGMIAAKAARLNLIGVLEKADFENAKFGFADLKLLSLEDFSEAHYNKFIHISTNN